MGKGGRGKRRELAVRSRFAMRTPLLPLATFTGWADGVTGDLDADCRRLRERLRELIDRPEVRDALFVASPDLSESIEVWLDEPDSQRGQRVERSLVRYASRMAGRATPFGLFSGVSTGVIGETTELELSAATDAERHTRLDNDYLFALGEALERDEAIRSALLYRPNNSIYPAAGRLRYAEARIEGGRNRSYHLVAVDRADYLERTLARADAGATREVLARALVEDDPEVELDEALMFVDEVIESQLLVSKLAPAVTGDEPIVGMLATLEGAGGATQAEILGSAQNAIEALDEGGIGAEPAAYQAIAETLSPLPADVELSRLFQVDMVRPTTAATLGRRVVDEMERAIDALHKISRPARETSITRFADDFSQRYEGAEVPLTLALDEELGVGFDTSRAPGAEAAPLLAGLHFGGDPDATNRVPWSRREQHLLSLVERAAREKLTEVVLGRDDLAALEVPEPGVLPDTFTVMAEIAAASAEDVDRGRFLLSMSGGYGPSGANILGRFCHADAGHRELVGEILEAEEALQPAAAFAEIVHLPEGRIGNILCRPVLRDYEIPYLGISGAPEDRQIPITDLMVSVTGGRVVLRSKRLDREVIPRMSSAHNYSARGLGVYKFLCNLQHQRITSPGWTWSLFDTSARFLPRVRLGKVVFSRARWMLDSDDIEPINQAAKGAKKAKTPEQIRELRARMIDAALELRDRLGLPRFVELADGDNELPVDFDNPLSVDSFAQLVKGRPSAKLVEMFPGPDQLIARSPEGMHVSQVTVSFARDREPTPARRWPPTTTARRRFAPGSPWLYAKLYTGSTTADDILGEAILPMARQILADGVADRWFFIRYGDPEWHLRLRFFGDPNRLRADVLPRLEHMAAQLESAGILRKLMFDTYERETERYGGGAGMELCEQLFWADSDAVAEIISLLDGDEGADARWRLALRGLDQLLDDLGLDLAAKRELMTDMATSFADEHNASTALKKTLGSRYRDRSSELETLLARDPAIDADHDLSPGFEILARRSERLAPITEALTAAELTRPIPAIATALCHMYVNRLARSAARAQEMVLYDLLRRHYDKAAAMARQAAKKKQKADKPAG